MLMPSEVNIIDGMSDQLRDVAAGPCHAELYGQCALCKDLLRVMRPEAHSLSSDSVV